MNILFSLCAFVSFSVFSCFSYGFVQNLAAPVLDGERASEALKNKETAEKMIQNIQRRQDQQQRQLDCLDDPQHSPSSEQGDKNPCY